MADEAEDVLELETELEADEQQVEGDESEGGDEDVIEFAEEGAAPAPESNSTIREMRQKLREAQREAAELRKQVKPQVLEIGEKPTLESCGYDEEAYDREVEEWKARKAQAQQAQQDAEAQREAHAKQWAERVETYKANKSSLKVSDYDAAEDEVFSALSEQHQSLIMLSEKPAVLVYALAKNPARLEELSKLDLARAAMMIGKLETKLTVTTRSKPQPDTPLRGGASLGGGDKQLEKLKAEAQRTGNYDKYFAAKRAAGQNR